MASKREQMSNVDKAWLDMDSSVNLMIINGIMTFDDVLDFDELKHTLETKFVARYRRFRQRVVQGTSGRVYWEDDPHFDIRAHVRRYALPEPGDKAMLQQVVSAIVNEPLDRRKPLWRYLLLENVEGGSAVLVRLHHSMADGIALIRVLLDMTGPTAEDSLTALERPHKPHGGSHTPVGALVGMTRSITKTGLDVARVAVSESLQTIEHPSHLVDLARSGGIISAASTAILAKLVLLSPDRKSAFKGELGAIKRVVWSDPVDLTRVKTLGKRYGATVNDVLVAAVAGSLRRYMIMAGDDPALGDMNAMVPINLRPEHRPKEDLGNEFALVYLSLPVSLADPYDRLMMTKRHMDVLKNSPEPFIGYQILGLIGVLPLDLARQATMWFSSKASSVLTNVPGPRQQIYFSGKRMRNIMFWVPQSGEISLGISIISYNNGVMLGIMADEGLVTDPQALIDGFEDELLRLEEQVRTGAENGEGPAYSEEAPVNQALPGAKRSTPQA
ncbi:MAG: wax ester/triacylglycerol synthase family O-acyltransferase [Anaerolineales bacterium]|nr:wax ester/triacylglycerol synthase family O-acyltransferase [Anaerolineales bacterium]